MGLLEEKCRMIADIFDLPVVFLQRNNEILFEIKKENLYNPFISVEMYREMVKPFHAREASFGQDLEIPIDMHNCGRCEDFIDDWLDFGVTCWNPAQVMNDLQGIKKKYGNRLVLEGCWDSQGPVGWPDATEEMIREQVRSCIDTFAPGGGFVFWASTYGAPDDPDYLNRKRWITEEYDAYGRTFYKK